MASLDKLEGGLAEGVGIVVLVIIAVILYGIYSGVKGLPNMGDAVSAAIKQIEQALADWWKKLWDTYKPDLSRSFEGRPGLDTVATGTNVGNWGNGVVAVNDPTSVDTYDSNTLLDVTNGAGNFGSNDTQLLDLSSDAQPIG